MPKPTRRINEFLQDLSVYRRKSAALQTDKARLANKLAAIDPKDRKMVELRAKYADYDHTYKEILEAMQTTALMMKIPGE